MKADRDKRRSPRVVTENLPGKMAFSLDAEILNISRGGIAIRSPHQLRIGSQYRVQIGEQENSVEVTGVVRRCRLKGTRKEDEAGDIEPVYEAGIEFEPPLTKKITELLPIMAQSASIQLAPRLFGRFLAPRNAAAKLKSDIEFEVKKISLSGLLTEAEGPPYPRESIDLEIRLGKKRFTCAGRIVNTETSGSEDGGEQRTLYGVEFVDPNESEFERLESFVLGQLKQSL